MKPLALMTLTAPRNLTRGVVLPTLLHLTWPVLLGLLSVTLFNLWEAYLLGRLGQPVLAAYGYAAPWMMIVSQLSGGLGVGAATLVARSVGQGDWPGAQRYTMETLKLGIGISLLLMLAGYLVIPTALTQLGAQGEAYLQAQHFLLLWWGGLMTVVLPTLASAILRALGDTYHAGSVLVLSAALNAVLDPLLITGAPFLHHLGFHGMGLTGVAIASIVARTIAFGLGIWWLAKHRKLFAKWAFQRCCDSLPIWSELLQQGIPSAASAMTVPVALLLITGVVSQLGPEWVGAFGLMNRLESLSVLPLWSLSNALGPFVGQNIAAGLPDRANQAVRFSIGLCWLTGLVIALFFALFRQPVSALLTQQPTIQLALATYLQWVPVGYGALGTLFVIASSFSAVGRPVMALMLNATRMLALYWPLAAWASPLVGWQGVVGAELVSCLGAGALAWYAWRLSFQTYCHRFHAVAQQARLERETAPS